MLPEELLFDELAPHRAIRVYANLALSRRGAYASIGERRLAGMVGINRRSLRADLALLAELGHISVEIGQGRRARYRLMSPMFEKAGAVWKECSECHFERPGLCKNGRCRNCNHRAALRLIVHEEVRAEIERTA